VSFDKPERIEWSLRQAQHILRVQGRPGLDEWLLIATNVGEADLAIADLAAEQAQSLRPLLDEVLAELRDQTDNFRDVEFLRATKPARRRNPGLFQPRAKPPI
jgi:hypothetical protein